MLGEAFRPIQLNRKTASTLGLGFWTGLLLNLLPLRDRSSTISSISRRNSVRGHLLSLHSSPVTRSINSACDFVLQHNRLETALHGLHWLNNVVFLSRTLILAARY